MRKIGLQMASSVLALATCFAANQASAQEVYSGGGSLAAKVYRQLFDCWAIPITGDTINSACPSASGAYYTSSQFSQGSAQTQFLYASVGSGAGKRAYDNDDGSNSTSTGLGSSPASNPPFTSTYASNFGYPFFHFAGSDDPIVSADYTTYNGAGGAASKGTGSHIQMIPAMVVDVAIAFNGTDGTGAALNIVNSTPTGGSSGLNLSQQAVCGIFTGHVTQWSNSILTALNGGTALGSGQITVVHRSDGSGTTFLTTNALTAQCVGQYGPNNESDTTVVSYALAWPDVATAPKCILYHGTDQVAWPDEPNGCTLTTPTGSAWANGSGSGQVQSKILTTNGSIGYLSPDYVLPVNSGGPKGANLQNTYNLLNGINTFLPPTPAGASSTISEGNAVFDVTSATNPLQWAFQAQVPNPVKSASYPIAGFTWLDFYQCYNNSGAQNGVLGAIQSYLGYFHFTPAAVSIMQSNGFTGVPGDANTVGTWLGDIQYLLTQSAAKWGNGCGAGGA